MRYLLAFLLFATFAQAQTPVVTQPYGANSNNQSSTITVTNTFQQVFPASTGNTGRSSCTIQNNSASNNMFVYFGPIANATTGASVTIVPGQAVYCSNGTVVLKDQVSITGTSGDAFFAAQQ
jgi:hypothetical protein